MVNPTCSVTTGQNVFRRLFKKWLIMYNSYHAKPAMWGGVCETLKERQNSFVDRGKTHDVCLLLSPYLIAYGFKNLSLGSFALPLTFYDPKSLNKC